MTFTATFWSGFRIVGISGIPLTRLEPGEHGWTTTANPVSYEAVIGGELASGWALPGETEVILNLGLVTVVSGLLEHFRDRKRLSLASSPHCLLEV